MPTSARSTTPSKFWSKAQNSCSIRTHAISKHLMRPSTSVVSLPHLVAMSLSTKSYITTLPMTRKSWRICATIRSRRMRRLWSNRAAFSRWFRIFKIRSLFLKTKARKWRVRKWNLNKFWIPIRESKVWLFSQKAQFSSSKLCAKMSKKKWRLRVLRTHQTEMVAPWLPSSPRKGALSSKWAR